MAARLEKEDIALMNRRELQKILADHADQLIRGQDQTESLIQQYNAEAQELAPLLRLAQRLQAVLVPVSPRAVFVQQLQEDLLHVDRQLTVAAPENERRPAWLGAATLGSLLSLVGLLLLLRRQRARPGMVEVAAG
jgi:DNA repair exonuclease SbcCD ATPase subunit